MRILHLVQSLETGGVETLVSHLAEGQVRRGNEVTVTALAAGGAIGDKLAAKSIPVEILHTTRMTPGALHTLRQSVLRFRPDIVHLHTLPSGVFGRVALLGTGLPWVYHLHTDYIVAHRPGRAMLIRELLLAKLPGTILAISDSVRDAYCRGFKVTTERVDVLRGGVPDVRHPDRITARKQLDLPVDRPILLTVAGLSRHKDHLTLLKTMRRLPKEYLLIIAGTGPLEERIRRTIQRFGIQGQVVMLGRRNDIPTLNAVADIALLTSHKREGLGLSLIEAARASIACIGTDVGGIPEVVHHNDNGLLVPPQQPETLANSIRYLIDNNNVRNEMGLQGRRRFLHEWELETYLDRLELLYNKEVNR